MDEREGGRGFRDGNRIEGGEGRGDTETKYMYMTAPSGDKYVKESKRAARGTKNEKKSERKKERDRDEDVQ